MYTHVVTWIHCRMGFFDYYTMERKLGSPCKVSLLTCIHVLQAFRRGIHYPRHLFITPAWYVPNWWLVEDQNYSCSALERASIMPLTLGVLHFDFIEQLGNIDTNTGIVIHFTRVPCNVWYVHIMHVCKVCCA